MPFTDVHMHALFGVDDGPLSSEDMERMIEAAYADGARTLCLTPHCHPGYYDASPDEIDRRYEGARAMAAARFPDLQLLLGNELHYSPDCLSWLESGLCRTMNGTRYVLVDFREDECETVIASAMAQFLNVGYIPILAHAERYRRLALNGRCLRELRTNGIWIQVNVRSLLGRNGLRMARRSRVLLTRHMVDLVASDAHDLVHRLPGLAEGYRYIAKKMGIAYAEAVCHENAQRLLRGASCREEITLW